MIKKCNVGPTVGEGKAPNPTAQRSQEFCADDNGSNYVLFVYEDDNLCARRILEIFHLYTGILGLLSPDKINLCCHPSLSYTGIRFHSITSPIFFSEWARVTMAIFLFAMGVSYHGHFSFHNFSIMGWSYQLIFLCNWLELPAQVYPRQLFTSRRCLK
jgi:hypothetical protein